MVKVNKPQSRDRSTLNLMPFASDLIRSEADQVPPVPSTMGFQAFGRSCCWTGILKRRRPAGIHSAEEWAKLWEDILR